jgi:hypothetical protein
MNLIPSTHTYSEIRWTIPGWLGRIQKRHIDTKTGIELPTDVTKSGGEVDKTISNVETQTLISENQIKGSSSGTISFDTELTKERKSSDD